MRTQLEATDTLHGPQFRQDAAAIMYGRRPTRKAGRPAGISSTTAVTRSGWSIPASTARTRRAPTAPPWKVQRAEGDADQLHHQGHPGRRPAVGVGGSSLFISITLELAGIPSLAFAVGVYLPLSSSSPLFVGGLVRWLVDRYWKKQPSHAHLDAEGPRRRRATRVRACCSRPVTSRARDRRNPDCDSLRRARAGQDRRLGSKPGPRRTTPSSTARTPTRFRSCPSPSSSATCISSPRKTPDQQEADLNPDANLRFQSIFHRRPQR